MATWPKFDKSRCNMCGLCVEVCPCDAMALSDQGPTCTLRDASCAECVSCAEVPDCGCLCEEVCPLGAISCSYEIVAGLSAGED